MPARPVLLDLFCGAGGAAMGYWRAGFDVVGIDIADQPRYPFDFYQADALSIHDFSPFAAIHASPPCQSYSSLRFMATRGEPLIEEVRAQLQASGRPYVIENVPGAPLIDPVILCGTQFGLMADGRYMKRHRLFETSFQCEPCPIPHTCHAVPLGGVYGHGGGATTRGYQHRLPEARIAMGIPWMGRDEISQAIPPIFTHYIGQQLRSLV